MIRLTRLCNLSEEMCQIERRIKYFVLPISIIATSIFIAQCWTLTDLLVEFVESAISISLLWIMDRLVILRLYNRLGNEKLIRRIVLQVLITLILSLAVVLIFFNVHHAVMGPESSPKNHLFFLKNLFVILFIFTLLVNGIYEIIFVFQSFLNERAEKEKYKKAVLQAKLENLRNQINPHFLFNTFNALSELIEEDPRRASNTVIELSDLYRYVLNAKDTNWETLKNEIAITHSFIEILKIRYEKNIEFNIDVENEYESWYLPPLVVQMLIENATKHNEVSSTNRLTVEIYTQDEHLVVQNNKQTRVTAGNSNGIGLKNIQERYGYLLNKELEIIDTDKEFIVKLPLVKAIDK